MASTLASLERASEKSATAAAAAYEELINQLEAGQEVDEKASLKTIREAGKALLDVRIELERRQRVDRLREIVASLPVLIAKRKQLEQELANKKEELERLKARFQTQFADLGQELDSIHSKLNGVDTARRELLRLVPPSAEAEEIRRELRVITARISRLEVLTARRPDPRARQQLVDELQAELADLTVREEARYAKEGGAFVSSRRLRVLEHELETLQGAEGMRGLFDELDKARARCTELQQQLAKLDH